MADDHEGDNASDYSTQVAAFYAEFDEATNSGKVLSTDWSSKRLYRDKLSDDEIEERKAWNQMLTTLQAEYNSKDQPRIANAEELLHHRILPPKLAVTDTPRRSSANESRKGRLYPPEVNEWQDFRSKVNLHRLESSRAFSSLSFPEHSSFFFQRIDSSIDSYCSDESTELNYLLVLTLQPVLARHGKIFRLNAAPRGGPRADFVLKENHECLSEDDCKTTVVGEFKSSHNLLLPVEATEIVRKYQEAYTAVYNNIQGEEEHPLEWSNICHPLGQLLGYMVDKGCRYGILTSATRTYFLKVEGTGDNACVYVADAFFPGEQNYLRAWAYIHSLGQMHDQEDLGKLEWKKTDGKNPTPRKHSQKEEKDGSGTGSKKRRRSLTTKSTSNEKSHQSSKQECNLNLPWVDVYELNINHQRPLGSGRNGIVYQASWGGFDVALKQFDVRTATGEVALRKELQAYARLKDAHGRLVPRPLFLSESPSGGFAFLALQIGRPVEEEDNISEQDCLQLLLTLKLDYGIQQNDPRGNFIMLRDSQGHERLAAIDFEDWEDIWE